MNELFKQAADIIQNEINPLLKGGDLGVFKKIDEVLKKWYEEKCVVEAPPAPEGEGEEAPEAPQPDLNPVLG